MQAPRAVQSPAPPAAGQHQLEVNTDGLTVITLNAEDARLSEVAADLGRRLRLSVVVGPALARERVTLSFYQFPLEQALAALAPRAYIDYDVRSGQEQRPRAVFLTDVDEPEPDVRGAMQGILISGHTEETAGGTDDSLKIAYEDNQLTLLAKEQPLGLVLMAIGETLNAPVDFEANALDPIDANFRSIPIEEAILGLSPNVRLQVRVDVSRGERRIKRIVLTRAPA